jgi:SAM-dependent methyltransferase
MSLNPTGRFSDRVEDYIAYRPGYPPEVLATLAAEYGLTPDSVVADIGSGTGILARLFLENGNRVYGVEPNAAMRAAGERLLSGYPRFASVAGTAEATMLPDACADFVTAGQAFHWFDPQPTRAEFARILRSGGWVALVWNIRRTAGAPLLEAYERLLRSYGTDYHLLRDTEFDPTFIPRFFAPGPCRRHDFANRQEFDLPGLIGRTRSSSYTPPLGHPNHAPMLAELEQLFATYQVGGRVAFEYDVRLYVGKFAA